MSNSFGTLFRWTTFGESHGPGLGVVIEGCPAGITLDLNELQKQLNRRRPGQKDSVTGEVLVTSRDEADQLEILSGVFEGKTLGTPISCLVRNQNQRSQDYEKMAARPGHADDVWKNKFGHSDPRGGGRSSGRETLSRVIAGAMAQQLVQTVYPQIRLVGFVKSIYNMELNEQELKNLAEQRDSKQEYVDSFSARFPTRQHDVATLLAQAKEAGESYGGVVEVWIEGVPKGLGEPVFYKMKNVLASAMMSIGATSGFEIGDGFALAQQKGTDVHRHSDQEQYGGQRGGITTGEKMIFRTAFKPTSSILDIAKKGRHDPCIVPRAVPVVEAMTWAVLADMILLQKTNTIL